MSGPLVQFDAVAARKALMEALGEPWKEEYEVWLTFKAALLDLSSKFPEVVSATAKKNKEPFPYHFVASTSCGTIELSNLSGYEFAKIARILAWAIPRMPPNFVYMAGEIPVYLPMFEALEKLEFLHVTRTWNPLHGHWVREYHVVYNYAGQDKRADTKLTENELYSLYYSMHSRKASNKTPITYVENEHILPEVPQPG